jgi:hypothetical protein
LKGITFFNIFMKKYLFGVECPPKPTKNKKRLMGF